MEDEREKKASRPISRVLCGVTPRLSFIFRRVVVEASEESPTPASRSTLRRRVFRPTRTSSPQASVYMNFQLPMCTARMSPWRLVSSYLTFSPLPEGGCFLLHWFALADNFPLESEMLCAARTFLPTFRKFKTKGRQTVRLASMFLDSDCHPKRLRV